MHCNVMRAKGVATRVAVTQKHQQKPRRRLIGMYIQTGANYKNNASAQLAYSVLIKIEKVKVC
jgi:hypothetical protein